MRRDHMPTVRAVELPSLATSSTAPSSVGTSFSTSKVLIFSVPKAATDAALNFHYLYVKCSSISSTTKITMYICSDAAGDEIIIPESEADITVGTTTATKGTAGWAIGVPGSGEATTLYAFIKGDAGTFTAASAYLTYDAHA
jgi:hypothetical protein